MRALIRWAAPAIQTLRHIIPELAVHQISLQLSGNIVVTNVDNNTYTNGAVITANFNFVASNYTISSGVFKVFVVN